MTKLDYLNELRQIVLDVMAGEKKAKDLRLVLSYLDDAVIDEKEKALNENQTDIFDDAPMMAKDQAD